jgi:hypothetical protein
MVTRAGAGRGPASGGARGELRRAATEIGCGIAIAHDLNPQRWTER